MAFTGRDDTGAIISEEDATDIIQSASESSAALSQFQTVRMSSKVKNQPVLASVPHASWLSGDTDHKPTSKLSWENVQLVAEELAVIVPVPEAVLDDAEYDIFAQAKPKIAEGFASKIDQAVYFGTGAPAGFGDSILEVATAAGNTLAKGTTSGQLIDVDVSDLMGLVEDDGFDVTGFATRKRFRRYLRGLRDGNGNRIYGPGSDFSTLEGEDVQYVPQSAWDNDAAELFAMDTSMGRLGIRQDLTFKVLTEATITESDGAGGRKILYSLAEQDMVALRCVMRVAWVTANPVNRTNTNAASRAPFAVLTPEVVAP